MNLEKLRLELEADEGVKYEIYLDNLDLPTCGIGHLIVEGDEECDKEVGTQVSQSRVAELFEQDIDITLDECERLYNRFYELPDEVQMIIANMMFNMGRPRLSKFKGMKAGIDSRDWNKAADEMVDSKWYRQVTNRAERLVRRMRNVA